MSLGKQLQVVKDNWLIVAALVVLVLFLNLGGISSFSSSLGAAQRESFGGMGSPAMDASFSRSMPSPMPSYGGESFYPKVEERKITKSANLRSEVEEGLFGSAEQKVKSAISDTKSILLNENVYASDSGWKQYRTGSYQVKVPIDNYESLIAALKSVGEVKSFSESQDDITAQFESTELTLAAERSRLERYQAMYKDAVKTEDKITLSDRIFEQERTVKYLEESLKNVGERVSYSTVYVEVVEKQSRYASIVFVKFSELVRNLVDNVNSVLSLLFSLLPWAVVALIGFGVWRFVKRK